MALHQMDVLVLNQHCPVQGFCDPKLRNVGSHANFIIPL